MLYNIYISFLLFLAIAAISPALLFFYEKLKLRSVCISRRIASHFRNVSRGELFIISREFPRNVHSELYRELQKYFAERSGVFATGVEPTYQEHAVCMLDCIVESKRRMVPITFHKIGNGKFATSSYAKNCLWLWNESGTPVAILLSRTPSERFVPCIEIAVPKNSSVIPELESLIETLEKRYSSAIGEYVLSVMARHFGNIDQTNLFVVTREFPKRFHCELYLELQQMLSEREVIRASGIELGYGDTVSINACLVEEHKQFTPFEYVEIDVGDEKPIQCVKDGLWLLVEQSEPMALLLSPGGENSKAGSILIEIAVPKNSVAAGETEVMMKRLEDAVKRSAIYRNKVLSLETSESIFSGQSIGLKVLRIKPVEREQLILPEKTITLLERNLFDFARQREQLRNLGLQTKKGLLFYGPPGTGKTHTLHFIITRLKNEYTTFILAAEQVSLLDEYCKLARLLQPSMIIIEDVDIIARERDHSTSEPLLNRLLNEMDGLGEDADVLFLLTTNRPEELEDALRNRPGRIDQAIEFPKPDTEGRKKLTLLYAQNLEIPTDVVEAIAKNTEGASAAFMKELIRRSTQFLFERDDTSTKLQESDWKNALDEMLTGSNFGVLKLNEQEKFIL
ncbi:MAG: ATP-binding protein [Planctomycetaceae bacterium]|jgi:hypothetical protein|nr:ATP-binding protein [Planctomycetaceae bacterium]